MSYEGVGTVEFLVDKHRNFYFMEMNTRIQVEHPYEEAINYHFIKVEIKIASGEPISGKNYFPTMHAIECRINAIVPIIISDQALEKSPTFTCQVDMVFEWIACVYRLHHSF